VIKTSICITSIRNSDIHPNGGVDMLLSRTTIHGFFSQHLRYLWDIFDAKSRGLW